MITNVSDDFRLAVENSRSDYLIRAIMSSTAHSGTLTYTEADFWTNGLEIEDSFAEEGSLGLGGCVITQARMTLLVDSLQSPFATANELVGSDVQILVGFNINGTEELISKFAGRIVKADFSSLLVTLTVYSPMCLLDKKITSTYAGSIVGQTVRYAVDLALTNCNAGALDPNATFPNESYVIQRRPPVDTTTYRDIICWAAQMAGGFARYSSGTIMQIKNLPLDVNSTINVDPAYNQDSFNDSSFYVRPNGGFWLMTDRYSVIHSTFAKNIVGKSVKVSKVTFGFKNTDTTSEDPYDYYSSGTDSDVEVIIRDNKLVAPVAASTIAQTIRTYIGYGYYWLGNVTHIANPLMESGDKIVLFDCNDKYQLIVSRTVFSPGRSQNTLSSGITLEQSDSTKYSQEEKNYADIKGMFEQVAGSQDWNYTYSGISIDVHRRGNVVNIVMQTGSTSAELASGSAYVELATLDSSCYPPVELISWTILNSSYYGQINMQTNGKLRIGYTRQIGQSSVSNIPSGSGFRAVLSYAV